MGHHGHARRRTTGLVTTVVLTLVLTFLGGGVTAAEVTVDPTVPPPAAFVQITAGERHTCGLTDDGTAWCWGFNGNGALGNGDTTGVQQHAPTPVDTTGLPDGTTFTQLTAGSFHTCGITGDGTAYCWGSNFDGKIGDGDLTSNRRLSPSPVDITGLPDGTTFTHLAAGAHHTCGITGDGTAHCWGGNKAGQLGNGDVTFNPQPTPSPVDTTGLPDGTTFVQLAAGTFHTCGITGDGTAHCWGADDDGQLGNGATTGSQPSPSPVDTTALPDGTTFTHLTASSRDEDDDFRARDATCGITGTGTAYCWGDDLDGQLGDGTTEDRPSPSPVDTTGLLPGTTFSHVAAGGLHTCAITTTGTAFCWGTDGQTQLGNGDVVGNQPSPSPVDTTVLPAGTTFAHVTSDNGHSCAVTSSGVAFCWGENANGQRGNGDMGFGDPSPSAVDTTVLPDGTTFTQLTAGFSNSCGVAGNGTAYCWGSNPPHPDDDPSRSPVAVDVGVEVAVADVSGQPDDTVTFTATASGVGPVSVIWSRDGVVLTGEDDLTLARQVQASDYDATFTVELTNRFGRTATGSAVVTSTPVADAGGPYTVVEGGTVALTGSGTDADGDAVTLDWDLDGDGVFGETGTDAERGDETGGTVTFDAAGLSGPDTAPVTLRVFDGTGTDTDTVQVTIDNAPPAVDAGGPYPVDEAGTVPLTATATDPGNDPLTYTWDLDDDGQFDDATGTTATFTAPAGAQTVTVTVRAVDDAGGTGTDTATVEVGNVAPTVDAGGPYTVDEGATITLTGVATDASDVTHAWDFDGDGRFDDAAGPAPSFTAPPVDADTDVIVAVQVTDNDGATATDTATITIVDVAGPTISFGDTPGADDGTITTTEGQPVTITVTVDDGVTVTWDLDGDGEFDDATGPSVTFTPDGEGTFPVAVQADDGTNTTSQVLSVVATDVDTDAVRLAGATRITTAIATSTHTFAPRSADAVVLARSDVFADALAGTALAVRANAPLLLTPPDRIPDVVTTEINRVLRTGGTVYVLGGPAALPDSIVQQLHGRRVTRLAGATRYDTAITIATEAIRITDRPATILLARGDDFPDGLAAGAISAASDGVVVLTEGTRPHPSTTAFLRRHPQADVVAVGGAAAAAHPDADPIVGVDRYATATRLAERFLDDPVHVGIARGDTFPDALTGGAHIGRLGGALLLTRPTTVPTITTTHLCTNASSLDIAFIYGGPDAITDTVLTHIEDTITSRAC